MAREFTAPSDDDGFRLVCPKCSTMWTTFHLPGECPECGAIVTVRIIPPRTLRVDTRKGDRHRADYWKTYQRPDRAAKSKEPK